MSVALRDGAGMRSGCPWIPLVVRGVESDSGAHEVAPAEHATVCRSRMSGCQRYTVSVSGVSLLPTHLHLDDRQSTQARRVERRLPQTSARFFQLFVDEECNILMCWNFMDAAIPAPEATDSLTTLAARQSIEE